MSDADALARLLPNAPQLLKSPDISLESKISIISNLMRQLRIIAEVGESALGDIDKQLDFEFLTLVPIVLHVCQLISYGRFDELVLYEEFAPLALKVLLKSPPVYSEVRDNFVKCAVLLVKMASMWSEGYAPILEALQAMAVDVTKWMMVLETMTPALFQLFAVYAATLEGELRACFLRAMVNSVFTFMSECAPGTKEVVSDVRAMVVAATGVNRDVGELYMDVGMTYLLANLDVKFPVELQLDVLREVGVIFDVVSEKSIQYIDVYTRYMSQKEIIEFILNPNIDIKVLGQLTRVLFFRVSEETAIDMLNRVKKLQPAHRSLVYGSIAIALFAMKEEEVEHIVTIVTKEENVDQVYMCFVQELVKIIFSKFAVQGKRLMEWLVDRFVDGTVTSFPVFARTWSYHASVLERFIEMMLRRATDPSNKVSVTSALEDIVPSNHEVLMFVDKSLLTDLLNSSTRPGFSAFAFAFLHSPIRLSAELLQKVWPFIATDDMNLEKFADVLKIRGHCGLDSDALTYIAEQFTKLDIATVSPMTVRFLYNMVLVDGLAKGVIPRAGGDSTWEELPSVISSKVDTSNLVGFKQLSAVVLKSENATVIREATKLLWNLVHTNVASPRLDNTTKVLLDLAQSESEIIRAYDFLYRLAVSPNQLFLEASDVVGLFPMKTPSKKGKIRIQVVFDDDLWDVYVLPSMLVATLRFKIMVRKDAILESIELICDGYMLPFGCTFEMLGLDHDCVIAATYLPSDGPRTDWHLACSEYNISNISAIDKAMVLLHSETISREMGSSILSLLNAIVLPKCLLSINEPAKILEKVETSLNSFEREYYLRVLWNFSSRSRKYQEGLRGADGLSRLVKVMLDGERVWQELCLIYDIIIDLDAFTDEAQVKSIFRFAIPSIVKFKTRPKLIRLAYEMFIHIASTFPDLLRQEVTEHVLELVETPDDGELGTLLVRLEMADTVYPMLCKESARYMNNEATCHHFFAVVKSIMNPEKSGTVDEIVKNILAKECPDYLFLEVCDYLAQHWSGNVPITEEMLLPRLSKTATCRDSVLTLLDTISKNNPSLRNRLLTQLLLIIERPIPTYGKSITADVKGECPVGLINLGGTCYMNVVMQMLRCTPFCIPFLEVETLKEPWQQDLQRLLALLQFGKLSVIEASEFASHFKLGGSVINVSDFGDAMEFLGAILDGLPPDTVDMFRGTIANSFEGISVPISSTSPEPFFSLAVAVENIRSLEKSLDEYCKEEVIQEYKSDELNKTIPVVHFTKITKAPNVLLFHLRRSIFDVQTGSMINLCTRFSFPEDIDMSPYCTCTGDLAYTLTGVVLHTELSPGLGHFHFLGRVGDKWYDFNDSVVTPFDMTNLEARAFGDDSKDQCETAYILCYTKTSYWNARRRETANLPPDVKNAIDNSQLTAQRHVVASSNAFFNITTTIDDPVFLLSYIRDILIHLNDPEKCEKMVALLTSKLDDPVTADLVATVIASDENMDRILLHCSVKRVFYAWIALLETITIKSDVGMVRVLDHAVVSLSLFSSRLWKATAIVHWLSAYLGKCGASAYKDPRTHVWPQCLIKLVMSWYCQVRSEKSLAAADFSYVFDALQKMTPMFTETVIKDIHQLADFVVKSNCQIESYFNLVQAISDTFSIL